MSPFFNNNLSASLVVILLLSACSTTATRTDTTQAKETAEVTSETAPLPRNYDQALVLMRSGDYQAAIPVLQKFIEEQPDLAGPYINLGIAYQQTAQQEAALKALSKAMELNPGNAATHLQLGILYREQGDFQSSLNAYNQALNLNPEYALAHRNVGILYDLYLQQPALALQHYKKYLELAGEPDQQVDSWVIDLERRSSTAQARVAR
ncbi:tetratricopeptide repeat protein [Thiogranum longum]